MSGRSEYLAAVFLIYGREAAEACQELDDLEIMKVALDPRFLAEKSRVDKTQRTIDREDM